MESAFKEAIPYITQSIIYEILKLIKYNFDNHNDTFYVWFINNSDYDFVYIYEMSFKRYFLDHFTVESEQVLSYYSQNLVYAVSSYYEMYRDMTSVEHFIKLFITKQFEHIDHHQLFLNENMN
jgi:hypothetical protein